MMVKGWRAPKYWPMISKQPMCGAMRMMPLPAARAASMRFQPLLPRTCFNTDFIRAQPHRQQFDEGLAAFADALAQQTFASPSGHAQSAVEHIVAHARGMPPRRPVNEPAQRNAEAVQHRQRQARQQFEQELHVGLTPRKQARHNARTPAAALTLTTCGGITNTAKASPLCWSRELLTQTVTGATGAIMQKDFIFTSESVSEGHPDKMADQVVGCGTRRDSNPGQTCARRLRKRC